MKLPHDEMEEMSLPTRGLWVVFVVLALLALGMLCLSGCGPVDWEAPGSVGAARHMEFAEDQKNVKVCADHGGTALTNIVWDQQGHEFHVLRECIPPPCTALKGESGK